MKRRFFCQLSWSEYDGELEYSEFIQAQAREILSMGKNGKRHKYLFRWNKAKEGFDVCFGNNNRRFNKHPKYSPNRATYMDFYTPKLIVENFRMWVTNAEALKLGLVQSDREKAEEALSVLFVTDGRFDHLWQWAPKKRGFHICLNNGDFHKGDKSNKPGYATYRGFYTPLEVISWGLEIDHDKSRSL